MSLPFVNRDDELAALQTWWGRPRASMCLVWGRRRVGKTLLLERFALGKRAVFHIGRGAPVRAELRALSRQVAAVGDSGLRDLDRRPFVDWEDALEHLFALGGSEPLLLVLDEFPELVKSEAQLEGVLRAMWDRARSVTKLRIVVCGSAVRTMQAMAEQRSPLYGRFDLVLPVRPFRPHEAALMLAPLAPADRALVWGVCGGVPLYLSWWDTAADIRTNLRRLVCTPGGALLTEGELVLATEGTTSGLARLALHAIATGSTQHSEIRQALGDPGQVARVLGALEELGLVERIVPVTEDPRRRGGRTTYRILDNFLAFWLGLVAPYRSEIERGLGEGILSVLLQRLDDHMGPRWEEAFRGHLRRMAADGLLGEAVTRIGPFWTRSGAPVEIDAVALAGRSNEAVLVGEAKWRRTVNGRLLARELEVKARALPKRAPLLRIAIAAREAVTDPGDDLAITAADVFGG
ncbi:MAG: ATP-binding protein [Egibacteraceae bacterium]